MCELCTVCVIHHITNTLAQPNKANTYWKHNSLHHLQVTASGMIEYAHEYMIAPPHTCTPTQHIPTSINVYLHILTYTSSKSPRAAKVGIMEGMVEYADEYMIASSAP